MSGMNVEVKEGEGGRGHEGKQRDTQSTHPLSKNKTKIDVPLDGSGRGQQKGLDIAGQAAQGGQGQQGDAHGADDGGLGWLGGCLKRKQTKQRGGTGCVL